MKYTEEELPKDWEIEAILPVYTSTGDCTKILLSDGKVLVWNIQMKRVLKLLAEDHCKTLALLRGWAAKRTEVKTAAPLAVDTELVLMPFRCRAPRVEGDNTLGCVNVAAHQPAELREAGTAGSTMIELQDGRKITACWNIKTMRHHWRAARGLEEELQGKANAAILRKLLEKKK